MYTTYTQGCFSFNFCPACQTTSIECSRNNIFSTYFVKVCLIRSRERRQNLTTFKNCAVELSCDHLDFLLKCYQSDHRSGFQFTCESSELNTVHSVQNTVYWLLVVPCVKQMFSMCVHFCQISWIFFIWNLQGFSPLPFVLPCFWPILFLQNFMKSKV